MIATFAFFAINRLLPLGMTFAGNDRAALERAFHLVWLATLSHAWLRPRRAWAEHCQCSPSLAFWHANAPSTTQVFTQTNCSPSTPFITWDGPAGITRCVPPPAPEVNTGRYVMIGGTNVVRVLLDTAHGCSVTTSTIIGPGSTLVVSNVPEPLPSTRPAPAGQMVGGVCDY